MDNETPKLNVAVLKYENVLKNNKVRGLICISDSKCGTKYKKFQKDRINNHIKKCKSKFDFCWFLTQDIWNAMNPETQKLKSLNFFELYQINFNERLVAFTKMPSKKVS